MVAWPLTRLDICVMSDGAAAVILASEEGLRRLEEAGGTDRRARWCRSPASGAAPTPCAWPTARTWTTTTFMHDYATEQERNSDETRAYYQTLWDHGTRYPGVHSFRAGRTAGNMAYDMAGMPTR